MKKNIYKLFGKPNSIKRMQIKFICIVFIPIILLFLVIRVFPIISNFGLSLTNAHLIRPVTKFIGMDNFIFLFKDNQFIRAFINSLKFIIIAVPAQILLGLFIAILLSRKIRGKRIKFEGFFQTLYFIPYLLPTVPTIIIWRWFFSPGNFGLANYLLKLVGISAINWTGDPDILILVIIGIHVWKHIGFFIIVFLIALKAVPRDIIEAARVDGANSLKTIINIELPIIKPTLLFGTVLASLFSWSAFTEIYTMTQGSDVSSGAEIEVLMLRMYKEVFTYSSTGRGSAISVIIFIMAAIFILIEFRIFKEKN
ncbi:MAG: sugar ABC transporter permease [Actinomycetia bacterium]|nr:sugar ABC transporter permease [Actinomycetes bacterium]